MRNSVIFPLSGIYLRSSWLGYEWVFEWALADPLVVAVGVLVLV